MPDQPAGNVVSFRQRLIDSGLATDTKPALTHTYIPTEQSTPTDTIPPKLARRWLERKLEADLQALRDTPAGQRNHTLNAIAYSLGRFCPTWLNPNDVADQLRAAAAQAGLEHTETENTIRSGLNSGMLEPRNPPVRQDPATDTKISLGSVPASPSYDTAQPAPALEPGEPPTPSADEAAQTAAFVRTNLPTLDWHALWADTDEEEWIIEPLLPARRLIALYSAPKVGKSLLLLELCVAIVTGRDVLGVELDRPRRVLYVDFENDPKADIRERLQAMSVGPDDLERLHYLSFPNLASLDSDRGGLELMAAVTEYACEVVVVDTVSRAIAGEENENDTWLNFYRHTGLRMKQAGVALIRLDHSGKDESKGQRGGSAKSGDVDAVWRLSRITDDSYRLDCEAARMPITEKTLVLHREFLPLRHRVDAEGRSASWRIKVDAVVQAMDGLDLPLETGARKAREALRDSGVRVRNEVIAEALRLRKKVSPYGGDTPLAEVCPDGDGDTRDHKWLDD